jgi:S1-C subfamily serine protease
LGFVVGVMSAWAVLPVDPYSDIAPLAGKNGAGDLEAEHAAATVSGPLPAVMVPRDSARTPLSPPDIAEAARDFTVFIRADDYYGSGVLATQSGYVITCLHVVDGVNDIKVSFANGTEHKATLVDSDVKLDLALLKIDATVQSPVKFGDAHAVRVGEDVYAFGAPRKMAFSMSRGMVSYTGRDFEGLSYLQIDLALNGGSSGGPIVNGYGEVVGISSFILKKSQGLSFALPIDYAQQRFARYLGNVPLASAH